MGSVRQQARRSVSQLFDLDRGNTESEKQNQNNGTSHTVLSGTREADRKPNVTLCPCSEFKSLSGPLLVSEVLSGPGPVSAVFSGGGCVEPH